jgi:hypothetical protein
MIPPKPESADRGTLVPGQNGCSRFVAAPWLPPYHAESAGAFAAADRVVAEPDSLVLVRPSPRDGWCVGSWYELESVVATIRRNLPASPVVLWLADTSPEELVSAVRAASRAQVRAIACGERLQGELVRAQLTEPMGLSSFVLRWALDAGYLAADEQHDEVRTLLDAAPEIRTLNRLSRNRQVAARTWRSHLQRRALPAPAAWLGLAHALHAALVVQRHAELPLHAIPRSAGVQTVNLSQRFRRFFALTPGAVRRMLGAEPLLHRWFARHLGAPARHPADVHTPAAALRPHPPAPSPALVRSRG